MALLVTPSLATEPAGDFRLTWEWPESIPSIPDTHRVLRVHASPVGECTEASLTLVVPDSIDVAPEGVNPFLRASTATGYVLNRDLGRWAAGESRSFDFLVRVPEIGGAVLEIRATGLSRGMQRYEAVGVVVGRPGPEPRRRDGVAEYPAASPTDGPG